MDHRTLVEGDFYDYEFDCEVGEERPETETAVQKSLGKRACPWMEM